MPTHNAPAIHRSQVMLKFSKSTKSAKSPRTDKLRAAAAAEPVATMIEGLEQRSLLSASVLNGVLSVNGSAGADTISVSTSGTVISVVENGAITGSFLSNTVSSIQ